MIGRRQILFASLFGAVGCYLASVAVGVADGWSAAGRAVAAQGFDTLGFELGAQVTRSAEVSEATFAAMPRGRGLAYAALALGLLLSWVGAQRLQRVARGATGLGWMLAIGGLASAPLLYAIHEGKPWFGERDLGYGVLFPILLAFGVWLWARPKAGDESVEAQARTVARYLTAAVFAPAILWAEQALVWKPKLLETHSRAALLVGCALVAALLVRRWFVARAAGRRDPLATMCAVAVLVLGAAARTPSVWTEHDAAPTLTASKPLNVIVLGIDTLRADATSLNGMSIGGHDTTPNLRALADRGVNFANAVSQAPWTLPSFGSMLTGKYPLEHGAFLITGKMRAKETTLAEVLREAGYDTIGVTSHIYVDNRHGLDQGFTHFDCSNALGHDAVTSQAVTDLAIDALSKRGEQPFFLFAHYFDAHYEFLHHEGWDWSSGYDGWLTRQNNFENILKIRHLLGPEEKAWLEALYEEEIAYLDSQIGRLLEWLRAEGLDQNTLIVVAGDHGEEFFERNNFGHTISLQQELVHVPLIVAGPGIEPLKSKAVVETRAIFGTVLDQLDVDFGASAREASLVRTATRERAGELGPDGATPNGPAYSIVWLTDTPLNWGKHIQASSARAGRWKLIHDVTRQRWQLFDLENDPGELVNRWDELSEQHKDLQAELEEWTRHQSKNGVGEKRVQNDPRTEAMLKELGYM